MSYNYQFVTTYTFYNKSLYLNNPISSRYSYEKGKENECRESSETQPETDTDSDSDSDEIDENFTSKYLYDNELLHAFHMEKYDANILSNKIFDLYNQLKVNREKYSDIHKLLQIADELSLKYMLKNDEFNGFMILFSFDFFHITHLCICDILNEESFGTICKNNLDFLIKNISL
jgi:hypothetical protein